jgi:hypothetical protein
MIDHAFESWIPRPSSGDWGDDAFMSLFWATAPVACIPSTPPRVSISHWPNQWISQPALGKFTKLYIYLVRGERYIFNEMTFRMQTIVDNSARIAPERTPANLKLPEIEYLMLNLSAPHNQLSGRRGVLAELLGRNCRTSEGVRFCLCAIWRIDWRDQR